MTQSLDSSSVAPIVWRKRAPISAPVSLLSPAYFSSDGRPLSHYRPTTADNTIKCVVDTGDNIKSQQRNPNNTSNSSGTNASSSAEGNENWGSWGNETENFQSSAQTLKRRTGAINPTQNNNNNNNNNVRIPSVRSYDYSHPAALSADSSLFSFPLLTISSSYWSCLDNPNVLSFERLTELRLLSLLSPSSITSAYSRLSLKSLSLISLLDCIEDTNNNENIINFPLFHRLLVQWALTANNLGFQSLNSNTANIEKISHWLKQLYTEMTEQPDNNKNHQSSPAWRIKSLNVEAVDAINSMKTEALRQWQRATRSHTEKMKNHQQKTSAQQTTTAQTTAAAELIKQHNTQIQPNTHWTNNNYNENKSSPSSSAREEERKESLSPSVTSTESFRFSSSRASSPSIIRELAREEVAARESQQNQIKNNINKLLTSNNSNNSIRTITRESQRSSGNNNFTGVSSSSPSSQSSNNRPPTRSNSLSALSSQSQSSHYNRPFSLLNSNLHSRSNPPIASRSSSFYEMLKEIEAAEQKSNSSQQQKHQGQQRR